MKPDYRYEIKFVVNEIQLSEFGFWMLAQTSMREVFPERMVNSLYFDDLEYQAARDNLTGLPNREKYRFRWYGDETKNSTKHLRLEKKVREGRLGYKLSSSLEALQASLLESNLAELKSRSYENFIELGLVDGSLLADIIPTLQVQYTRQYFQDLDDIRITVDRDIRYYHTNVNGRLFQSQPLPYSKKVIEVKFSPHLKPRVAELIKPLHLVPQRCSKYLQGLSMCGITVYT